MTHDGAPVQLREVVDSDVPLFYDQAQDAMAQRMALTPVRDRAAFDAHWAKIRADAATVLRTIVVDGAVAGNVLSFERDGHREVGYWIGRPFWGRGVATEAVRVFLSEHEPRRPLYGHVAKHNGASMRVLEKCGFKYVGENKEFARLGDQIVEGVIYELAG
jgi:RimJ/RimL family protein N-acetyltransferase